MEEDWDSTKISWLKSDGKNLVFDENDYDALLKQIDDMDKPALKQTSNSWIIQLLGFLLVLILVLVILFGC